jgi:ribonuclease P protein component
MVNVSGLRPESCPDVPSPGKRMKFPRSLRLNRRGDFEKVYKLGRRYFAAHLTVFYLGRERGDGLRVGFRVGRVLGDAVERNRIKRRLREAVRLHRSELSRAVDIVVHPKKSVLKVDFAGLENEIRRALEAVERAIAGS